VPKPYLLNRPSGAYARFLVPADLRERIGSRFVVRALHALHGDEARLVASTLALLLSKAFEALRRGEAVGDIDKLLSNAIDALKSGKAKTWEVEGITPDGRPFRVTTNGTFDDNASGERVVAQMSGTVPSTLPTTTAPAIQAPASNSLHASQVALAPLLSKATTDYLSDLERAVSSGGLVDKTHTESAHSLRILAGVLETDKPVSHINADDMRAFFDVVMVWPAHAWKRQPYKGKTVKEVARLAREQGEPLPSPFTVEKHRQRLAAFFNHLIRAGVLEKNPVHGVAGLVAPDPEEDSGRPFTDEELGIIFEQSTFAKWAKKYPHRWLGTMLGLHSGARITEVAQLEVSDVECVEGIWGFSIRPSRPKGKRVKNKQSRRFVPIADAVLSAGFLDYVEEVKAEGHVRLFPNLPNSGSGYGVQMSKQFCTYLRQQGIHEEGSGFHYFRHTIASFLDGKVSEKTIVSITGHKRKGSGDESSIIHDFYIKKTLAERKEAVDLFKPNISLPTYTQGQFKHALRSAEK
jgi:integrase